MWDGGGGGAGNKMGEGVGERSARERRAREGQR